MMKTNLDVPLLLKIFLPLVVISLLGISTLPHEWQLTLERARRSLEANDSLSAATNIARLIEYYPWRSDLWEMAGRHALQAGDPHAAMDYFSHAVQSVSLSPAGYAELGDAAQLTGDLDTATRAWQAAIELGEPPLPLYRRLEAVHDQQGDYAAMIADLRALADLQPADSRVHYRLGVWLAAVEPDSALAYLTRAAELDPAFRPAAQAIQRGLDTARLADEPAYTLLVSGRVLASLGEWEPAAEAFRRATDLRPDYAEAWAFLGESRQHHNHTATDASAAGLAELQQAFSLDPQSVVVNTLFAIYWQRQTRFDLALDYLHVAAEAEPRNPALQAEIGNTLALMGNLPDAQGYYQRAAGLNPRDAQYWRTLAAFSIKYKWQLHEIGLPAARQAVLLAPKDAVCLDMMAQVFLALGDLLSARRFLARALQADAGYALAHLHLGLVYLEEGDARRASEHFALARALSISDSEAARLIDSMLEYYLP